VEKPGDIRWFAYAAPSRPPEDDWLTVVGRSFVAVIESRDAASGTDGSGLGTGVLRQLSALAARGECPLEDVVSAIPLGADGADSFAVVHVDAAQSDRPGGWQVTAVTRGRAVVDVYSVGGSRRFSSSGVQPWLIATFRDTIAVELGGPARRFDAVANRVPGAVEVSSGMTRAGSVLWSGTDMGTGSRRTATYDAAVAYLRPAAALDEATVLRGRSPSNTATDVPHDETIRIVRGRASDAPRHVVDDETVRIVRDPPRSNGLDRPADTDQTIDDETVRRVERREIDERTALRPRAPLDNGVPTEPLAVIPGGIRMPPPPSAPAAAVPAPPAPPSPPQETPADRFESSAEPTNVPALGASATVVVAVRGGEARQLHTPIVFGRRPSRSSRGGVEPQLVTVASPDHVVSASHLRVERIGSTVVITDLRSRNGTTVVLPGRPPRRLRPGESIVVVGTASVDIGDGTIIDIIPEAR